MYVYYSNKAVIVLVYLWTLFFLYSYLICQFSTGGCTQKARPVEVLTRSQGNLEAKGEPRTTNMGQIM